MDKWTDRSRLECDIVGSLAFSPRRWRRLSRRPGPVVVRSGNDTEMVLDSGQILSYRIGEDQHDLSLAVKKLTAADAEWLRQLRRDGVPVYVYVRQEGALQHYLPLMRRSASSGIMDGDPADATYTGVAAADTTVYVPRADAGGGWYLELADVTEPIIYGEVPTANSTSTAPTVGPGYLAVTAAQNEVKNSLFGDVTSHEPADWDWDGTPGTDAGVITSGWMGVPALWLSGTTSRWKSSAFAYADAGYIMALSFGWKTDGTIRFRVGFGAGGNVDYSYSQGCGYVHEALTVPAHADACSIQVQLTGGTYGEFCAPQVVMAGATTSLRRYPLFLGGDGDDVLGEITTGPSLVALGSYGAMNGTYSVVAVTGYVTPLWPEFSISSGGIQRRIFTLQNTHTSDEISCDLTGSGGVTKLFCRQNNTAYGTAGSVSSHALGDQYVVCLYAGYESPGTYKQGALLRKVGGSSTVSVEFEATGGALALSMFHELYVGCNTSSGYQPDAVITDVQVSTMQYSDLHGMLEYLSVAANLTEFAETRGRLYKLTADLSPSPWERGYYDGIISGRQVQVM